MFSHPPSRGREALFICLIPGFAGRWKTSIFYVLQRLGERLKAQNRLHYMDFSTKQVLISPKCLKVFFSLLKGEVFIGTLKYLSFLTVQKCYPSKFCFKLSASKLEPSKKNRFGYFNLKSFDEKMIFLANFRRNNVLTEFRTPRNST